MPLTLKECQAEASDPWSSGRLVLYRAAPGARGEEGRITSVSSSYVFVRFGADTYSKACRPQDLEWVIA